MMASSLRCCRIGYCSSSSGVTRGERSGRTGERFPTIHRLRGSTDITSVIGRETHSSSRPVALMKDRGDRRDRRWGFPHSDEMRLEERYKRTNYTTVDVTVTIIDPKAYTKPWVTHGTIKLRPGTEISEYFCVPSESQ